MGKLEGKIALITGGASGIGSASGLLFAQEGARVAIVADKNVEGGKEVVRRILETGGQAIFLQADVTIPTDAKRIVDQTVREFGRLDILFNNAGATLTKRLHETTVDDFDKVIGVNLKAVFLVSRYAVEQMLRQGGGVILTNASKAAVVASDCSPVYAASKGGVLQLMQAMAVDYAKDNIRVNSLLPGIIDTPMTDLWIANQSDPGESRRRCEQAQPIKRMGTSEECARAALFLVSDDSNFITGTHLLVDGGYCAQ